jgi:hypothetical protein
MTIETQTANPVAQITAAAKAINPNFDVQVDAKELAFRFKKDKLGNQRQAFTLTVGVPSVEGLIAIIEAGGNGLKLLQEAAADVTRATIAGDVADDTSFNQTTYDTAKLTLKSKNEAGEEVETTLPKYSWEAIANMPREDRRANAIPTEVWEAFGADYLEVMPSVTGKTAEQVGNAVTVYQKKFSMVKTNKPVLESLKTQLGLYMEHSKKVEDFTEILELLLRKLEEFQKSDDVEKLVANL